MNKLIKKIVRRGKSEPEAQQSQRITTETIAEHREKVLASGRRFKYPLQYARHKLVFNAIIIAVVALLIMGGIIWEQLYVAQSTSDFMYRVTKVIPLPVAYVDGQPVLYSDYLVRLRSQLHYLETKQQVDVRTPSGKRQVSYEKQQDMQKAIEAAYATKLAHEKKITVTDQEVTNYINSQRQTSDGSISSETSDAVILDYYGWTPSEYHHVLQQTLLEQKVSYAVDDTARATAAQVQAAISAPNADFRAVVAAINQTAKTKVTYGVSGMVQRDNQDGGLAAAASLLQKGQISPLVQSTSGAGYYYLRLTDSTTTEVNYEYIQIPLGTFKADLANLQSKKKVDILISMPKS